MGSSQRSKKASKRTKRSKSMKKYKSLSKKYLNSMTAATENTESVDSVVESDHAYSQKLRDVNLPSTEIDKTLSVPTMGNILPVLSTDENMQHNAEIMESGNTCLEVNIPRTHSPSHVATPSPHRNVSMEISGCRIVDLGYVLKWSLSLQKICTTGKLFLHKEVRNGWESNLFFKCTMCNRIITKSTIQPTEPKQKGYGFAVEPSGLFVDLEHGFLGASPDGLIGNDYLVEVKCLPRVNKSGKSLLEAAKDREICLDVASPNHLRLKRNHNYYYQIQGQLNIASR